ERAYCLGCNGALGAFFVHNDTDNLNFLRCAKLLEDPFTVRHLWHGFRRDEANRINMSETRHDQLAQVLYLPFSRDTTRKPLPCVARTFDKLDGFGHGKLLAD